MTQVDDLLNAIAAILRQAPQLQGLAPNWGADDARAHVFVGQPPVGAANAGRAPFVVIELAEADQAPRHQGDRRDGVATALVRLRLAARDANALAERIRDVLAGNRHLGDPDHVLDVALDLGPIARAGPCQATTLTLRVRRLIEPSA